MIEKQFINEDNLQIAMTEYKNLSVGKDVLTEYNKTVGTVTQVYDNTHRSRRAGLCSCKKF